METDEKDIHILENLYESGLGFSKSFSYDEAVECFNKIIEMNSNFRDVLYQRGVSLLCLHKYHESIDDFDEYIKFFPRDGRAFRNRGMINLVLGNVGWRNDFILSIQLLTNQIKDDPTNCLYYRYRGSCLDILNEKKLALIDFNKSVEIDKNDNANFYFRGRLFFKCCNFGRAFEDFSMSITLDPKRSDSYNERGCVLLERELYLGNAIWDFTKAIELNPKNPASYNNRGKCFKKLGDFKLAQRDLDRAHEIDPFRCQKVDLSAMMEEKKEIRSILQRPENCNVCGEKGILRCKICDWIIYCSTLCQEKDAEKDHDPISCVVMFQRMNSLFHKGLNARIKLVDMKRLSSSPYTLTPEHNLALISNVNGNHEEAVLVLGKIIRDFSRELFTDYALLFLHTKRAESFHALGRYEEEVEEFSRLLEVDPLDRISYCKRILARIHMKDFGLAYFEVKELLRGGITLQSRMNSSGSYSEPVSEMAQILGHHNYFSESHDFFKKAIELDPRSPEIYRRRIKVLDKIEPERAADDASLVSEFEDDEYDENLFKAMGKFEQILDLEKKKAISKLQFGKDLLGNVDVEKERLLFLKEKISKLSCLELIIHRKIGRGSDAFVYLCGIKNVEGIFVLKVPNGSFLDEYVVEERMLSDSINIPYHRNCVIILACVNDTGKDKVKLYFSSEEIGKEEGEGEEEDDDDQKNKKKGLKWRMDLEKNIKYGFLLMKFYPIDLGYYCEHRYKKGKKEEDINAINKFLIEICYILQGLLEGVGHLNKNMIVHRDLHFGNVFIDPAYGRVLIGDYGRAIDLRKKNKSGEFIVLHNDQEEGSSFSSCFSGSSLSVGAGAKEFLPPEVVDVWDRENVNGIEIDYEKCDLFSIGMIGYLLVDTALRQFAKDREVPVSGPFGIFYNDEAEEEQAITKNRVQESYIDLEKRLEGIKSENGMVSLFSHKLFRLIKNMLILDQKKRINHQNAKKEIKEILNFFEEETLEEMVNNSFRDLVEKVWGVDIANYLYTKVTEIRQNEFTDDQIKEIEERILEEKQRGKFET